MVTTTHTLADEEIKKDLTDSLYWDGRVNAADVDVEVHNGNVTLSGTVPTYTARRAAFDNALMIQGVVDVINNIDVSYPSGAKLPSDAEIRENVEFSIIRHPDIDATQVEVYVENGIVTLKGTVDAYWKKMIAEDLAADQSGVLVITNEIAVVPTESPADQDIARDIVAALERNSSVDPDDVNVTVNRGEVELSGIVPSWQARLAARRAAQYTVGVADVIDTITVGR